jgi:hypothetical protein
MMPAAPLADEVDDGVNFAAQAFPDATVDQNGNVSIGGGTDQQENLTPGDLFPDADADAFTDLTRRKRRRPPVISPTASTSA